MTKTRAPLSFSLAVMTIIGVIGPAQAKRVTGRSDRLLRFWSESDRPDLPALDKAIALDRAFIEAGGGFAPILESYARQLDVSLTDTIACRTALAEDIATVSREVAEAIGASVRVMQPDASDAAFFRAVAETEQASSVVIGLLARLRSFMPGNRAGRDRGNTR
ncbi:hypothetical protein GRI97_17555 [Altererythrobacter xixiisoli]|uniref:Uncharacterized protein n=1 Tax=Croceibacterium xixiisoli TaxID=1476466 RepID=A0A6I4U1R2_9SPHN|nr:hypothetical protein [Croceibacterium xixiisoli]MXP00799.1 hypothetical protein [Croceibacterium xixiisoli]